MASPRWSVFAAVDARQAAAAFSGVPPAESGDATAPALLSRMRRPARSTIIPCSPLLRSPRTPGPVRGPSIPRTARVTVPGFYTRGAREPTVMGGGAIGPARGEERDGIASLVGLRRSGRTASSGCVLRRAASGERRRDRARSPLKDAPPSEVYNHPLLAPPPISPHPWPGSRPLHPPHRSRHGAGILRARRARAHGDGRWRHRSRSRRGTRWHRLAGRSSPQWTHGKQRLRLQRLLLAEGRQWV